MSEDSAMLVQLPEHEQVLSDRLPSWASIETTDSEMEPTDSRTGMSDSHGPNRSSDVQTPGQAGRDSGEQPQFVTVCSLSCRHCDMTSARWSHCDCQAPVVRVGGDWQCTGCGTRITPSVRCGSCGGPTEIQPLEVPLDLGLDARPEKVEQAIHDATNARRTSHGLDPLEYSTPLSAIALQYSRRMAQRQFFAHTSPDGDGVADRYRAYGHRSQISGENLAKIYPVRTVSATRAAERIVDRWMNSPGHRENLLRPEFSGEGLGVYCTQTGAVYATQNFE